MDKGGIIIEESDTSNLPNLLIDPNLNVILKKGEKLSSEFQFATLLLQKMYFVYNTNHANVSAYSISFDLNEKKVVFPLNGDIDVLLGSLTVILSRLNSENNYSIIDLRYKNPILK
ncbi:hypothetical protein KW795_02105 [Candidatus Microgenomates bacterium]|nr:hypothetical protein [Candidatus Microgenomates bacterium]